MVELKIKKIVETFDLDELYFSSPIVFFAQHPEDKNTRNILPTLCIFDCQKKTITYYIIFLKENREKLDQIDPGSKVYKNILRSNDPHSYISLNEEKGIVFLEQGRIFLEYDFGKESVVLIKTTDILEKKYIEETEQFSSTNFLTKEDGQDYFYFANSGKIKKGEYGMDFYRYSRATHLLEKVHSETSDSVIISPHVIKKIGDFLFCSDFGNISYKITHTEGVVHYSGEDFFQRIYTDLLGKFKKIKERVPEKVFTYDIHKHIFDAGFEKFILLLKEKGGHKLLIEFIRKYLYPVEIIPGDFYQYAIKKGFGKNIYKTTFAKPAHFETNLSGDKIYVSSHNFDKGFCGEKITYFGPAALDVFHFDNKTGSLVKEKTFIHETGYRFTSHRFFTYNNRNYICTIGHPNRLFFIDADTMQLEYFIDIDANLLDELSSESLHDYLVRGPFPAGFARALEVSSTGRYIFIPMESRIILFDFENKNIARTISVFSNIHLYDDISLADFKEISAHCQNI